MKNTLTVLAASIIITSCASATKPEGLDSLTKIRFGEPIPEDQNYILYFEAGQEIPMTTVIDGDLINNGINQKSTVTLKKSIYTYKQWVSLDGTNWIEDDKLLDLLIEVKLPGYHNPNPGLIHLKLDEKKQ